MRDGRERGRSARPASSHATRDLRRHRGRREVVAAEPTNYLRAIVPAQNLFELLTKWPHRETRDPVENRLTATLVAVADRYPPLQPILAGLAGVSVAPEAVGSMRMHPAARAADDRYIGAVDAELRIADAVVWWEAKVSSGLSDPEQLTKYVRCLPPARQQILVLLAPARRRREFADAVAADERLHFVAWEDVLRVVRDAAKDAPPDSQTFIDEALRFFSMHGFHPTTTLDPELLAVLKRSSDAYAALDATLGETADRVDARFRPPVLVYEYERHHRPTVPGRKPTGWGNSTRLVWDYAEDLQLYAGLYYDARSVRFRSAEMLGWLSILAERELWDDESGDGGFRYVGMYRVLDEFVAGSTAKQGERIAEWICQVFDHIIDTRP